MDSEIMRHEQGQGLLTVTAALIGGPRCGEQIALAEVATAEEFLNLQVPESMWPSDDDTGSWYELLYAAPDWMVQLPPTIPGLLYYIWSPLYGDVWDALEQ